MKLHGMRRPGSRSTRRIRSCIWIRSAASISSPARRGLWKSPVSSRSTSATSTRRIWGCGSRWRNVPICTWATTSRKTPATGAAALAAQPTLSAQVFYNVQTFPLTYQTPLMRLSVRINEKAAIQLRLPVLRIQRRLRPVRDQPELPCQHRLHQSALVILIPLT